MTLHYAIEKLLRTKSRSMTTSEIANELNQNKWYTKKDGSLITPFQIHGRTRNYSHLFKRQGSLVALFDQPFNAVAKPSKNKNTYNKKDEEIAAKPSISIGSLEINLLDESKFRSAASIDLEVPAKPGLYCIRIKSRSKLPFAFADELTKRQHNIIYIGKASQNLNKRLVSQELRAKGHGTFFRSIGAVIGYRPAKGSLIDKKNKRNYKFSSWDESNIIAWINNNLLINWVEYDGRIVEAEKQLILKYKPLLNIDGNPFALGILKDLRSECVRIANQI